MKNLAVICSVLFVLSTSLVQAKVYTAPLDIADIVYNIPEIQQRLVALNSVTTQKIKINKIQIHRALQYGENCFYAYTVKFENLSKEDEEIVGEGYWTNNDRDGKNSKCLYEGTSI